MPNVISSSPGIIHGLLTRALLLFIPAAIQRLDPAVMLVSCNLAGTLLARLGRPEVANCIAGLKQYSYAYEEAADQANEMSRMYNRVRMGDVELSHMAMAAPRVGEGSSNSSPHGHHGQHVMPVDDHRSNGSSSHVRDLFFSFVFPAPVRAPCPAILFGAAASPR